MRKTGVRAIVLAILAALHACFNVAWAEEITRPAFYEKRNTWQDTAAASVGKLRLMRSEAGRGEPLPDFGMSDYTVCAWIRTTQGGVIFSMSSENGVWAERGGKVFFSRSGKLGFDACYIGVISGSAAVADGKWHHVAVAYSLSQKNARFFVDGRPDGGGRLAAEPDAQGHIPRLGMAAKNFWPPNGLAGDIDEVRIYDRALPPAEIADLFADPKSESPKGCIARYTLDDGVSDASGNGNHGTPSNIEAIDGIAGRAAHFNGEVSIILPPGKAHGSMPSLWAALEADFPDAESRRQMRWEREDGIWSHGSASGDPATMAEKYAASCRGSPVLKARADDLAAKADDASGIDAVRAIYHLSRRTDDAANSLRALNFESARLCVSDLAKDFGGRYPNAAKYLAGIPDSHSSAESLLSGLADGNPDSIRKAEDVIALCREAVLANPLLDFDKLLLVKRDAGNLGLPMNWQSNSCLPKSGYDNEIAVLSPLSPEGSLSTLYHPGKSCFVGDVELHFDGDRMIFSMPSDAGPWGIYEMATDGSGLRKLQLIEEPDVDNYDACYLPDGNIIFSSTAPFTGVPCVQGSSHVSNLYLLNRADGGIRRLTFEQDHDWCPTVLNDGRVLYLRWEYSDIPHFVSRILFHMNPDGTGQMEFYGSNSYWPNSMFYARPIPDDPTKFVAVVGGHHDNPRMGELVLFDTAKGRREADGVIQRIPGRGKPVTPIIKDGLTAESWPKFLHPYPLSDKYFLVSCKPTPESNWGIYLVDVFDNMTLIKEIPGFALLEPIPLRATKTPPAIPPKVDANRKDALVHMSDIYAGHGLAGVPRGTVKSLRIFTYHFAYHGMGGQINRVGLDGPWDIKRIVGTVPVEDDGSACFTIPANTPISVQPLDAEGKALQLMRSWMTAMPGETLSCVGCHETQNSALPQTRNRALIRAPSVIEPWLGPARGFSFEREVQPVLDRHCVNCHNGSAGSGVNAIPDFRRSSPIHTKALSEAYNNGTWFSPSYLALRGYVRTPTIESDMHLLAPCDFHADATELIQILSRGHYGVSLDRESWDRIITWYDLNAPFHGTWHEMLGKGMVFHQRDRRREMMSRYAGIDEDPEEIIQPWYDATPVVPAVPTREATASPECPGWPFRADEAARRQSALGKIEREIDLGDRERLELRLIPPGEFIMGDSAGFADEADLKRVKISDAFWIGKFEVTNAQFRAFDPRHDSRIEHGDFLQFSERERGYSLNHDNQPVVRVSHLRATAYCEWLSKKTGMEFRLPTEEQWEYACRAGSDSEMWYGPRHSDFSRFANLADSTYSFVDTFDWWLPSGAVPRWRPAIEKVKDGYKVSAPVGSFAPNPWGLHDMHGNVWEWTGSDFESRDAETGDVKKVVKGGSWADRPQYARSASRRGYRHWQRVYNVGFRVVCPAK
ncbi:MAG TPA: SUMF1/EgtB/PvdO family nonheme iron enzyme [Candidatus Brocadiia bacterium]|nr:SUMF1/EgtB/PvdO family nonheme iron enzyme [Candidatus Brocadiia bacterium]